MFIRFQPPQKGEKMPFFQEYAAIIEIALLSLFIVFIFAAKTMLAKKDKNAGHADLDAEIMHLKSIVALNEEHLKERLADKDMHYGKIIEAQEKNCAELLKSKESACEKALAEKDSICEKLLQEKEQTCAKQLAEKERVFAESTKALEEKFANLAAETLEKKSKDLTAANKTSLDAALKPLADQMKLFQEATQKAQLDHKGMNASIHRDVEAIGRMARDLSGFANALKSGTKVQGRAGEEILAEKLRQAGLEENVNFFLQKGTSHDRPDAQICDTENRWVVIDSKVSLTAFAAYGETDDETLKKQHLASHVNSIREKIDELISRKYPDTMSKVYPGRDYLPVTAMFVPHETALAAALAEEPSLWQRAAEGNVVLVTPVTLLGFLRLVYLAWQHEKQERNQQAIIDTAKELLSRMNNFLMAFENFGKAIDSLQKEYESAKGFMIDKPHAHTIAKSAQKLIDLHVKLENRKGRKLEKAECLELLSQDKENTDGETAAGAAT